MHKKHIGEEKKEIGHDGFRKPCDLYSHLPVQPVPMNQLPSDSSGYVTGADRIKLNQMLDEFDVENFIASRRKKNSE
jgi:hypothetical protein